MKTLSLRARLTLWYTVVLVVVVSAFAIGVVWMQGRIGVRNVDRELAEAQGTAVKIVGNELDEQAPLAAAAAEATDTLGAGTLAIAVFDGNGSVLSSRTAGLPLAAIDEPGGWRVLRGDHAIGGTRFRILVAIPLAGVRREQREVREAMLIAIPILLAL